MNTSAQATPNTTNKKQKTTSEKKITSKIKIKKQKKSSQIRKLTNTTTQAKKSTEPHYETVDLSKRKRSFDWDKPYLLAAYAALWIFLFFYLILLTQRLRQTENDIKTLESILKEKLDEQS